MWEAGVGSGRHHWGKGQRWGHGCQRRQSSGQEKLLASQTLRGTYVVLMGNISFHFCGEEEGKGARKTNGQYSQRGKVIAVNMGRDTVWGGG